MSGLTAMGQAMVDAERKRIADKMVPKYLRLYRILLVRSQATRATLEESSGFPRGTVSSILHHLKLAGIVTVNGKYYTPKQMVESEVARLWKESSATRVVSPTVRHEVTTVPEAPVARVFTPEAVVEPITVKQAIALRDYLNKVFA